MTDHHDVFTKLASVFQERVSPHVVLSHVQRLYNVERTDGIGGVTAHGY